MKNLCLFLAFIILLPKVGKSQMCNTTPTNMGVLTLTSTWQNTAANSGAKRYWTFNATAGCTYGFSSCNSINTIVNMTTVSNTYPNSGRVHLSYSVRLMYENINRQCFHNCDPHCHSIVLLHV